MNTARGLCSTGLIELDSIIGGGLHECQLITVAGRMSVGKSAFVKTVAMRVAQDGVPVLICTPEMSVSEIMDRMFAERLGLNSEKLKTRLREYPLQAKSIAESLGRLPILFVDSGDQSIESVEDIVRKSHASGAAQVVFIDRLQCLNLNDQYASTDEHFDEIARRLKWLANGLRITIIATWAIPDVGGDSRFRTPRMLDTPDAVFADPDVALILDRPGMRDQNIPKHVAHLLVVKNRLGPTGRIDLRWHPEITRFTDDLPF